MGDIMGQIEVAQGNPGGIIWQIEGVPEQLGRLWDTGATWAVDIDFR